MLCRGQERIRPAASRPGGDLGIHLDAKGNFSQPQKAVIPANAGIQFSTHINDLRKMDSRIRGNDRVFIDPAIKHGEELSFPREGGDPSLHFFPAKLGPPPSRGKDRVGENSTHLIAVSIDVPLGTNSSTGAARRPKVAVKARQMAFCVNECRRYAVFFADGPPGCLSPVPQGCRSPWPAAPGGTCVVIRAVPFPVRSARRCGW